MSETTSEPDAKAARIAELRAELDELEAVQEEQVEEALEDAAETVEEAIEEATEEAADAIEEETGHEVTADEREVLAGIIATAVAERLAPYLNPIVPPQEDEVAEAIVEADDPHVQEDTAPIRTHWTEKRVF